MSVGYGIELDLYVNIQEAFEEVKECEHSSHNGGPNHYGDAEWYMQIQCPNCGHISDLKALCPSWVSYVEVGGSIWCAIGEDSCDEVSSDWKILVKERIKK